MENYRCDDQTGTASRVGASVLLGRFGWLVRPALRAGMEYDWHEVSPTGGASLTFGRRYGARVIIHIEEDHPLVLFQIGRISFVLRSQVEAAYARSDLFGWRRKLMEAAAHLGLGSYQVGRRDAKGA